MNPFKIIEDIVASQPLISLYFSLLISVYAISSTLLSKILANSNGKTELWFALSTSTFEEKVKRFGKLIFSSTAFKTINLRLKRLHLSFILTDRSLTDRVLGIALIVLAVAPWISALLGVTAAWGGGTFAYSRADASADPGALYWVGNLRFLLITAIFSGLALVTTDKLSKWFSLLAIISFAVWIYVNPSNCCFLFNSRYTVFYVSYISIIFVAVTRSGSQAAIATMLFLVAAFVAYPGFDLMSFRRLISYENILILAVLSAITVFLILRWKSFFNFDDLKFGGLFSLLFFLSPISKSLLTQSKIYISEFDFVILFIFLFSILAAKILTFHFSSADAFHLISIIFLVAIAGLFITYSIRVSNWGDVLKVVQLLICLPILCISLILSFGFTATLSNLGFRQGKPLRYSAIDVIASMSTIFISFWIFAFFSTLLEARPGAPFLRIEDIVNGLKGSNLNMLWIAMVFLLPALPSSLHLSVAVISMSGRMPSFIKRKMVEMLEREDSKKIGIEEFLVTFTFSVWISFFTATGVFLLMFLVNMIYRNADRISTIIGNLI